MASAQKRTQQDSQARLARISHHFLSESRSHSAPNAPFMVLPIAASSSQRGFPLEHLCRILGARGCTVMLVEQAAANHDQFRYTFHHAGGTAPRLQLVNSERPRLHDWLHGSPPWSQPPDMILLPQQEIDRAALPLGNRLLLPVNATPAALRNAYLQIKHMSSHVRPRSIAITVIQARSAAEARRYFSRLAVASLSFLGIKLLSYGHLLTPGTDERAYRDHLHDVADLLLGDWRTWREQRSPAARPVRASATADNRGG